MTPEQTIKTLWAKERDGWLTPDERRQLEEALSAIGQATWEPYPKVERFPVMTPEERARHAYQTIEALGWSITHRGHVPDDGWPIDIIAKAIRDALADER